MSGSTRSKSAVAQLSCSNFGSTDVSYNHLKRKDRVVLSFNMVLVVLANLLKNIILPLQEISSTLLFERMISKLFNIN